MSKRKTSRKSPQKPRKVFPVVVRSAMPDYPARFRRESDMIASALDHLPALDRAAESREMFPYNTVASSDATQRLMMRIVRRRLPASAWPDACAALIRTDDNGKGFAEFLDVVRDVAFMAGVEYAQRSLPAWWSSFLTLDPDIQRSIGVVVDYRSSAAGKAGA